MNIEYKENQMRKLNEYAREYIDNNNDLNYQNIAKQMREFSGADYVMLNIFDDNGKEFTLVGFKGNKISINKAMDIIGYNIIGKKFEYEEGRNERFEKSIVTKVTNLKELVGGILPERTISIIEKVFPVDHILVVRVTKNRETIGSFNLIFYENQNKNDHEMLKLFASQVGLFIDKKNSEQKTLEATRRCQALIKNSVSLIHIFDNKGNYIDVSDATADLLGLKKDEIIGNNFNDIMPKEKAKEFLNTISTVNKTKRHLYKKDSLNFNNKERIYESVIFPIEEIDNEVVLFGSIASEITEKEESKRELINKRDKLRSIIETTQDGFWIIGENKKIIDVNDAYCKMTEYSRKEILNLSISDLEFYETPEETKKRIEKIKEKGHDIFETKHIKKNGDLIDVEISVSFLNNEPFEMLCFCRDITEKKKRQKEIEYLSFHDHLTGLYNRRFFEEEIKRIDVVRNLPISIITLDVNGLKLINDTFGHSKGDEILVKIAQSIKNSIRSDEIAARIGGDEFSIILPKCTDNEAHIITERIKENTDKHSEGGIPFSLAIGFHTKEKPEEEISEVLKKAESKMYTNKLFSEKSKKREIILTMLSTLHEKHLREEEHSIRVSQLAYELGKALKMKDDRLNMLKTAGLLHDIGKIGIDYSIIEKPGRLTEEEYKEIKKHPEIGYRILKTSIEYEDISKLVLYHHEKIDGSGYPKGIKDSEIPLESKIISIVDAFDAMISSRPYKTKMVIKEAAAELKRCSGTQFDPTLVEVFTSKVIR